MTDAAAAKGQAAKPETKTTEQPGGDDEAEDEQGPRDEDAELPTDLKESFAILKAVEAMPETTPSQERAKQSAFRVIRAHIFRLQQGLPHVHMTADHVAAATASHGDMLRETRWEQMSRIHPVCREMLDEIAALRSRQRINEKDITIERLNGTLKELNAAHKTAKTTLLAREVELANLQKQNK
ncbi:MAG TPA: hypothetical protein VFC07_00070 [Verrucomicrobiae bacterium]|nr:hypothetical protein [Verrucomicrobiae bacterium]